MFNAINHRATKKELHDLLRKMEQARIQMLPYMERLDDPPVQLGMFAVSGVAALVANGIAHQSELFQACTEASRISGIPAEVLLSHGEATVALLAAHHARSDH